MEHKDFFKLLIGEPPPEIQFEIELQIRETNELPDALIRQHCSNLIKHNRLQDFLLMAALARISDAEAKLYKAEKRLKNVNAFNKSSIYNKIMYVLFGKSTKK
tara:strand:+ start:198 stop:506 length:309 start_codon:yes stop_codon:yes gene_type:complete